VALAGFKPDEVKKTLKLTDNEHPIYIMPIGKNEGFTVFYLAGSADALQDKMS